MANDNRASSETLLVLTTGIKPSLNFHNLCFSGRPVGILTQVSFSLTYQVNIIRNYAHSLLLLPSRVYGRIYALDPLD